LTSAAPFTYQALDDEPESQCRDFGRRPVVERVMLCGAMARLIV
jgi:hypothetical protein